MVTTTTLTSTGLGLSVAGAVASGAAAQPANMQRIMGMIDLRNMRPFLIPTAEDPADTRRRAPFGARWVDFSCVSGYRLEPESARQQVIARQFRQHHRTAEQIGEIRPEVARIGQVLDLRVQRPLTALE